MIVPPLVPWRTIAKATMALPPLPFWYWKSTGSKWMVNDVGVGFGIVGWGWTVGWGCCWCPVLLMEFDGPGTGRCDTTQLLASESLAYTALDNMMFLYIAEPPLDGGGGRSLNLQ